MISPVPNLADLVHGHVLHVARYPVLTSGVGMQCTVSARSMKDICFAPLSDCTFSFLQLVHVHVMNLQQ